MCSSVVKGARAGSRRQAVRVATMVVAVAGTTHQVMAPAVVEAVAIRLCLAARHRWSSQVAVGAPRTVIRTTVENIHTVAMLA